MKKSFTTTEVGNMFGVDKTTVGKWVDTGKLKGFKTPGGHRRIFPEDLALWLRSQRMEIPDTVQQYLPEAPASMS